MTRKMFAIYFGLVVLAMSLFASTAFAGNSPAPTQVVVTNGPAQPVPIAGLIKDSDAPVGTRPHASFHQLIFGRGFIGTARFTSDGQSVIYGAAWNNTPFEIYSTRLEGLESRSLGLPSANILGIAANGQMALALGWHHTLNWMGMGTLGEVPLSGGAPRPLLEKVCAGDISQDGIARFPRTFSSSI